MSTPLAPDAVLSRGSRANMSDAAQDDPFDLIKEEIAVMKKLNHTNLVSLVEVLDDPEEDSLFMVLEMCKKGVVMKVELDDVADPYSEEECRTWFRDLILGIEYLHAQGIIHRDIKPDNCLLTDDDTLKIVDFGVSEMFEKASEMRIAKSAGSPAFMAPELCIVNHGDVSGKSADIWSMGVTLYCLRLGKVPFCQTSMIDLYQAIVNEPVPLEGVDDQQFRDLMTRLLEKDPQKRITMEELRVHPWVTRKGTDPLLPAEENCAVIVELPTESEMNAAITSNVGRVIAVMKAVSRFKTLIERKRPDLVNSILGHASRIVKPPLSMLKSESKAIEASKRPIPDREIKAAQHAFVEKGDMEGAELVKKLDRLPAYVRTAVVSSSKDSSPDALGLASPDVPPAPAPLKKFHSDPVPLGSQSVKGHARDPLEHQLFLNVGTGPSAPDGTPGDDMAFFVSESPPPVDYNVYESAYQEEVDKIYSEKGRRATVYLTRRVEKAHVIAKVQQAATYANTWVDSAKAGAANVVGDEAFDSASKGASLLGSSAKSGLANIIGKTMKSSHTEQSNET
ncbi:MAG: hypothetical protein M1831_002023 [Alyxoria varia]|nr:MAG: hypothetical protein M1831_002023 [Alyxoria varia]